MKLPLLYKLCSVVFGSQFVRYAWKSEMLQIRVVREKKRLVSSLCPSVCRNTRRIV